MSADDFFSRWSKNKAQAPAESEAASAPAAGPAAAPAPELPPPTLEDVAALGHDADFSRFVKPGVDEAVRRSAMKKLFTDPHFNVMDGLDIYIGDYNTFEPLPAAMLAMLVHAKPLLDPLGHLQQPAMKMLSRLEQLAQATEDQQVAGENPPPADEVQSGAAPDDVEAEIIEQAVDSSQAMEDPVVNTDDTPTDPASPEDDHTI
jgi:hypothetical protein